jgi:hypothetical protein
MCKNSSAVKILKNSLLEKSYSTKTSKIVLEYSSFKFVASHNIPPAEIYWYI